jgi:hypothetical protein
MRIGTTDKPLQECEYCAALCADKAALTRHIRWHAEETRRLNTTLAVLAPIVAERVGEVPK